MAYKTLVGDIKNDAKGNKADFYNNTIANTLLMPTTDSLVSSHPLDKFDVVANLYNDKEKAKGVVLQYKLILPAEKDPVEFSLVQSISGMGMSRENEQQPDTQQSQTTNLPGQASYDDISISLTYTKSSFFLTWLTNGVTEGGAFRSDIEIHVSHSKKSGESTELYVITLHDAFPVKWSLSTLDSTVTGENGEKIDLLTEDVTLTYSYLDISLPKSNSNGGTNGG